MKIYISHSKSFNYEKDLYDVLEASDLNHEFIFPHKDSKVSFNSKDLFKYKGCDLVLAEVSNPATGQGIELGWADVYNIPVVCIYNKGSKVSGSLKVICGNFIEYENGKDLIEKLKINFDKKKK